MNIKKMVVFSIVFSLLMCLIPFTGLSKADDGYGIITTDQGEMYKDLQGNLFSIVVANGEKLVKLNEYELAPLKALLERDAKESKGESALPEEILKEFYATGNYISQLSYFTLPAIYSYNQRYWKWGSTTLGFGPSTIASAGCFLTSCAMMLATYNLTINGYLTDPLNLNTWLKGHSGFSGDLLVFGAIANFPGIRSIGYFDSFNDAAIAIYNHIVPILAMRPSHYSPLVKTNGVRDRTTNWIMNTYSSDYNHDYWTGGRMFYAPYTSSDALYYYKTIQEAGYDFANSEVFRTAYPQ